jgi:spore coat protein U-like protein
MKSKLSLATLGMIIGLALAGTASAGNVQGSLPVSASVAASCKIASINAIAFGAYDPANVNASSPLDATGQVNVSCTKGDAVSITLDQGANAATGSTCVAPGRQMKNGANMLGYAIYSDTGRTTAWGCDTTNQVSFTSASASTPTSLTTYGRVPGGQDVPSGNYADTVTVSVTF